MNSVEISQRFDLACALARSAGEVLMGFYGRLSSYERKGDIDLVTVADRASEEHLIQGLSTAFADDEIWGEEGGVISGASDYQWVLDPLDGTTNFVHGFPFFMVSIAVRWRGERVIGVCYGPVMDELYSAYKGGGAYLNDASIRVSQTERLGDALLATGFPYNRREIADELLSPVKRAMQSAHGVRRAGAAAYDQCLLACGKLDGFFEVGLAPWDTAAGSLILEEAGGVVETYQDANWNVTSSSILASNGKIQHELRQRVIKSECP